MIVGNSIVGIYTTETASPRINNYTTSTRTRQLGFFFGGGRGKSAEMSMFAHI